MLTPMDIHNHEFKKAFRGYSENDVDDFLDQIVADYEKLIRENEQLKEQLSRNDKEIDQYKRLEKNLQDTLVVAQKTAEEVVSAAKKNSEEILRVATKNADELRENTGHECRNLRESTTRECDAMREKAQLEIRQLENDTKNKLRSTLDEYERIVRDKNSFLLKIRTALESELAVTVQLLSAIPNLNTARVKPIDVPADTAIDLIKNDLNIKEKFSGVKVEKDTDESEDDD